LASTTVPRRSAVSELSSLLDSPELAALVADIEAARVFAQGRRGYGVRTLLGAALVKYMYALPTWTRVADLIADHEGLQRVLGGAPSHWALYRFSVKLRKHKQLVDACLARLSESLRAELPGMGDEVAIDASDMPAYANGQRFLYNHGPERQAYSDPDASWGHRSAVSTRKGGGFYGYKIHAAVCAVTGLPLAWHIETARRNESLYVAPLLDAVRARGFRPTSVAMDGGYDHARVYAECHERGAAAIVPLRKGQPERNLRIPRASDEWRSLYRRRSAVEREFGNLKHNFGLAVLRVRGLARVALHADLCILARLALALTRARAVPLVA
jgi:hypothetical protein